MDKIIKLILVLLGHKGEKGVFFWTVGANFVALTTKHQVSVARFGLKALGVFPAHFMVLGA